MFCDSHYISRFAAFFIVARAKRSTVESFNFRTRSDEAQRDTAARSADAHLYDHKACLMEEKPAVPTGPLRRKVRTSQSGSRSSTVSRDPGSDVTGRGPEPSLACGLHTLARFGRNDETTKDVGHEHRFDRSQSVYRHARTQHAGGLPPNDTEMIPPQVHLRRPCYDFYFL
jgi:hypothetical protein